MKSTNHVATDTYDATIQFTPVSFGGQSFNLFFNLKALSLAQKTTGINFLQDGIDFKAFDAETFIHLIHAGLLRCHPELTEENVADLVGFRDLQSVMAAGVSGFGASQMESDPENPPTPPPAG